MANSAELRLSEDDEDVWCAETMTTTPSQWAARLGWGAFLIAGAVVVTSGFEVPSYQQGSPQPELGPSPEPAQTDPIPSPAAQAPSDAAPEHVETSSPHSKDLDQLNMRELEARIRDLEARLADGKETTVKEKPAEVSLGPKVRASDHEVPELNGAKSERDEQIERETEERAKKMVSEIRDQLSELEGERARQMEEMLDAAK